MLLGVIPKVLYISASESGPCFCACLCETAVPISVLTALMLAMTAWSVKTVRGCMQATLGHMFHTTEEAISSPLPSPQATSPRAYSPQPQGRLALAYPDSPDHGHHITHFRYVA